MFTNSCCLVRSVVCIPYVTFWFLLQYKVLKIHWDMLGIFCKKDLQNDYGLLNNFDANAGSANRLNFGFYPGLSKKIFISLTLHWTKCLITARKLAFLQPANEVWGKVMFFTPVCRSFCSRGRGVPVPLHAGTHPPGQVHPPGRYPQAGTPLCALHAGIRSTSGRYASHWNAILLFSELVFKNNLST